MMNLFTTKGLLSFVIQSRLQMIIPDVLIHFGINKGQKLKMIRYLIAQLVKF